MSIKNIRNIELNSYSDRLQYIIHDLARGKQNRFAKIVGKTESTISTALSGKNRLKSDSLGKLSKLGVNINWLETGEGEPYLTNFNKLNGEDQPRTQAERIRYQRELKGWTQQDLANELGLKSSVAVSYWETGKRTVPVNQLIKMARLFEVQEDYMLKGDQKEERQTNSVRNGTGSYLTEAKKLDPKTIVDPMRREPSAICPNCDYGHYLSEADDEHCLFCGSKLITECPQCKTKLSHPQQRFCPKCGYNLKSGTAE